MASTKLRYSLASLLLLFIPAAFAANYARGYFVSPEINWQEFDMAKIERNIASGKKTLVYYHAWWWPGDSKIFNEFQSNEKIGRLLNREKAECMRASHSFDDDEIRKRKDYFVPGILIYDDAIDYPAYLSFEFKYKGLECDWIKRTLKK